MQKRGFNIRSVSDLSSETIIDKEITDRVNLILFDKKMVYDYFIEPSFLNATVSVLVLSGTATIDRKSVV